MFNPEKMLGSLLMGGMQRKRGLGGLLSGGVALGLVGVAMEAAEHYLQSTGRSAGGPPAATPPGAPSSPASIPSTPPGAGPPPPPPGPPPAGPSESVSDAPASVAPVNPAVLLIRAMIAAANADGVIDASERGRIMTQLDAARLSPAERRFMAAELDHPRTAEGIAADLAAAGQAGADVQSPELARQVYLASLLAVEVDTPEERAYLENLAGRLGLDAAEVTDLHNTAGVAPTV